MNGDLGNLLTGELGEAEARFAHDDFAGDYGQRIAGRVRRRRAVRAAGVGGGTMLTAGALVLGATQMPWGTLGAEPGVGGSDCATPWPSLGAPTYSVVIDTDQASLMNLSIMDASTGTLIVGGTRQAGGTYLFTDGYGDPLKAVQGEAGLYTVALPAGVTSLESTATDAYRSAAVSTNFLSVKPPRLVVSDDAARQARGECYTPDPTFTPTPEAVTSPFQCGFELPTESLKSDDLWIDGAQWMDGADATAAIGARYSDDPSQAPEIGDSTNPVPVVTVHFAGTETGDSAAITWGTSEPSIDDIEQGLASDTSSLKGSEGATFVGVADGRVVATGNVHPDPSGNVPPAYLDLPSYEDGSFLYLLDQAAALTSCDANPVDFSSIDLYAVAGLIVKQPDGTVEGPTYAWLPVGEP